MLVLKYLLLFLQSELQMFTDLLFVSMFMIQICSFTASISSCRLGWGSFEVLMCRSIVW